MSDEKKRVPKLRFPEFTEDWEQCKLPEFVSFFNGLTYTPDDVEETGTLVLRSSNVKNGEIVNADNVYVNDKVVTSENVQEGDIIVVVRNGSRALIGKHAQIKASMPNTVIGAFMSGMRSEHSSFVNALLDTSAFENEIAKNMGATINQITGYMFSKMEFMIPAGEEQKKIGEYFSNLDHLITFHQRRLKHLEKMKKGLLQNMFPKKGETCPQIRFPGFNDDWEQRKLGEVAEIVGGGTPSTNVSEYWDGNINWYTPAEISDQIYLESSQRKITEEGYSSCSAKMLPVGTVLFTSRAGIGKTAILSQKSCTNQGFQSIVPHKDKLDSYFIFSRSEELKRYGETVGAGSTFVEVSGKQMADMDLMLPKNITEQQIIGSYFKNLDHLITLHQRKLEHLQKLKKGLLQQMFI